jgi:hypothetical protein
MPARAAIPRHCWLARVSVAFTVTLVAAVGSTPFAGCKSGPSQDVSAQHFVRDLSELRALRLSIFGEFGSNGPENDAIAEEAQVHCAIATVEWERGGGAKPRIGLCNQTIGALEVIPPPLPAPRNTIDDLRKRAAVRVRAALSQLGEEEIQDYLRRNGTTLHIAAGALRDAGCSADRCTVDDCELDAADESGALQLTRLRVSRPGFNRARTRAVIYASRRGEYDERAGELVLFEQTKTGWTKVATAATWVM